jgi:nicotinate-nucleotide adenylyltransferase
VTISIVAVVLLHGFKRRNTYFIIKGHRQMNKPKIGVFAGTFDPVHTGHLAFALKSIKEAKLDAVYFLPERCPRHKPDVVHFGHRTAMLTRAIRPYKKLGLLELPDIYFDVKRTLPKLQKEFTGAEIVFLMGSDTVFEMNTSSWATDDLIHFFNQAGLVVGLRSEHNRSQLDVALSKLPTCPDSLHVIELATKHLSSSQIRHNFRHGQTAEGLLDSVQAYASTNWLYVSLTGE